MKNDLKIRIALCICCYMSLWGLLYPELLVTPDTCSVVYEEETEGEVLTDTEELSAGELYQALLEADRGQIRYRSRLLELLEKLSGKRQG